MHPDQRVVSAFAEGISPYRLKCGGGGVTVPAGGSQQSSEHLQRVQSKLPPVFRLQENPILVPVRQQLAGERSYCCSTKVRRLERLIDGVQKAVGERL